MGDIGNIVETLQAIILDFQEFELQTGVPRRLKITGVPGKATVCTGVRRCGKSIYLFQVMKRLLDEGVPRESILYVNFFDDRLHTLRQEGLGSIAEAYYSLYPEKKNTETVYFFFHAMVTSVASGILVNTGHLLENLVFTALRRITPDIWYCKTKGGSEVDFLAQLHDRSRMLVQVCESMAEPRTRKRELAAVTEAMAEYGLESGTVVTRNEEHQIQVGAGKIEVVPAWRFLLKG